jgi:DNA-binding HxlR family transcriptional regulator
MCSNSYEAALLSRGYQAPLDTRYPEVDMSAKRVVSKCPIEELLVSIGGRWKPVILWWLFESEKPLRFKVLRQVMRKSRRKILTQQLRD